MAYALPMDKPFKNCCKNRVISIIATILENKFTIIISLWLHLDLCNVELLLNNLPFWCKGNLT